MLPVCFSYTATLNRFHAAGVIMVMLLSDKGWLIYLANTLHKHGMHQSV